MKAVVLAAGYATKLYPFTMNQPKALLPIKSKPLLDYIIEKISEVKEVDEIFIITNDRFYMDFVWWLNKYKKSRIKIEIINDGTASNETRLGGIGDLCFAIEKKNIKDNILVVLSDNLFDFSLQEMVDFFKKVSETVDAVYDLHDFEEVKKMSVVKIENNKLVSFEEKPQNPESTLASIGLYIFSQEDLGKIQDYMKTEKPKDAPGFLIQDFCKNQDVYAFQFQGRWFDIGSKETYEKVNEIW